MWIHPLYKTLSLILSQNACSIRSYYECVYKNNNNGVIRIYNMNRRQSVDVKYLKTVRNLTTHVDIVIKNV